MSLSKKLKMKVTLSTNALLLSQRHTEVLPYVDEVGIPLDGSNSKLNEIIRRGTLRAFDASLSALELLESRYPDIYVTVRTVVSRKNKDDIVNIGSLLTERPGLLDRWKIYQFAPVSIGLAHIDEHYISTEEFDRVVSELNFPELNITVYPNEQRVGRYVFVGPEGNVFGVDKHGDYQVVANFLNNSEADVLLGIDKILDPDQNRLRGLG
jgi:MoaA/NifB/PqqE/SkfB family radical SAM enzyme